MLYGVDVDEWVWRPDVRLLVGLIERLPYEPRSMYRARSLGDDAWFGWTTEAALLAEMVDMQAFAAATAAVRAATASERGGAQRRERQAWEQTGEVDPSK